MAADRQTLEALTKRLADEGKLIEAGWVSLRMHAISEEASEIQLHEMRLAFMAGAQHLFGSICVMLDPGVEATDNDLKRLDMINEELNDFAKELSLRLKPVQGRG